MEIQDDSRPWEAVPASPPANGWRTRRSTVTPTAGLEAQNPRLSGNRHRAKPLRKPVALSHQLSPNAALPRIGLTDAERSVGIDMKRVSAEQPGTRKLHYLAAILVARNR